VIKEFREGGVAFAGKTITPVAAGVYVIGLATNNRGIRDGVWGCVASYGAESIVRSQLMYRLVGRERPDSLRGEQLLVPSEHGDQYRFEVPGRTAWGMHSLPAGHVANIAACAGFLSARFNNPYITIPAQLAVAAVGVGRMVDRRHWLSDTVLGVLFGYAVGKQVALRSLERRDRDEPSSSTSDATRGSLFFSGGDGLRVGWKMTF
jgi:membrane-associated phospholipid phosphatase